MYCTICKKFHDFTEGCSNSRTDFNINHSYSISNFSPKAFDDNCKKCHGTGTLLNIAQCYSGLPDGYVRCDWCFGSGKSK